jgi:hypothetical protein
MTDIDALVSEARALFLIGIAPRGEETMAGRLIDALTAERARVAELETFRNGYKDYIRKLQDSAEAERKKVAALEADVKFWQKRHDNIQDRRKIDDAALQDLFCRAAVAAGYPADDEDQSNDAHIGRLFIQHRYAIAKAVADQAEAVRWREVAGELAEVARSCLYDYGHPSFANRHGMAGTIRAALARFKQESGQ